MGNRDNGGQCTRSGPLLSRSPMRMACIYQTRLARQFSGFEFNGTIWTELKDIVCARVRARMTVRQIQLILEDVG